MPLALLEPVALSASDARLEPIAPRAGRDAPGSTPRPARQYDALVPLHKTVLPELFQVQVWAPVGVRRDPAEIPP
jgi:hypothetical protein